MNKSLPQFKSAQEAMTYFEKYGRLEYFGRGTDMARIINYHVKDGRLLRIYIYDNGKVEYINQGQ
ncbi:hypothetical protein [Bacillus sp. FJAT-26390]|uniref:hypothetical protein n=1 Tax=Bacillus sp. FJAT-26390 TaxID=1743142 RepID=UPI00080812A9|nr:hypothetical protein [Bacillus sp. FJAT-26390]OBZ13350.1 hypothetical protein A7975_10875 [Bacillus sp. FJAT-26390]